MARFFRRSRNSNSNSNSNSTASHHQWSCPACTYGNDANFDTCKICFTARIAGGSGGVGVSASSFAASSSSAATSIPPNNSTTTSAASFAAPFSASAAISTATPLPPPLPVPGNPTTMTMTPTMTPAMTPSLLTQKWKSHGPKNRLPSLTTFSQSTIHIFSNYVTHPPVSLAMPPYCQSSELISSGRSAQFDFPFAEMAIMACKAALFRDYATYDKILTCRDWREAKALGRHVKPFHQRTWDAQQCSIVREVSIAKLAWDAFRTELLQTGSDVIAECTIGDWVWGTALDGKDPNVYYPGRWKGGNILGWSLIEAREEAGRRIRIRRADQDQVNVNVKVQKQQYQQFVGMPSAGNSHQQQPQPQSQPFVQFVRMPSAPSLDVDSSLSITATATASATIPTISSHSISYLATQYSFGPNAFGPLHMKESPLSSTLPTAQHTANNTTNNTNNNANNNVPKLEDLSNSVKDIIVSSVPVARHLTGERGKKPITKMLTDIYHHGLFMHGNPTSSINRTIIPAFRHIIGELNKLDAQDTKRIAMARNLVDACQDCQQVQARVILRMYSDLTCKTQTLESQLKYSLVRSKEAALQVLITKYHSPSCDYDHTMVGSERQRAHLWSGYVALVGDAFGLDGLGAARGDRFLDGCLNVIRNVHTHGYSMSISSAMTMMSSDDGPLKQSLVDELTSSLCVKEWLSGLIGDINNQSANADRTIDRSCIFAWATANTSLDGDLNHRIFYDEARAVEYSDLDPKEPTDENKYEPFFSPVVLVETLVKVGLLKKKV